MDFGLRDWARREPGRTAVVSADGMPMSYGELDALVNRLARLIRASGLKRGDHMAAVLGNDPMFFAIAWACWRSGIYFTTISTHASSSDALYLVNNCQAKLVLVDARFDMLAGTIQSIMLGKGRCLTTGGTDAAGRQLEAALADFTNEPIADESPGALMLYTSGTTGAAKGVWRPLPETADGPPVFARDLLDIYKFSEGARFFSPAPLYHAAPLRFGLAMLTAGAMVYLTERFDAAVALDMIEREQLTHTLWVPTMLQRLMNLPADRRKVFRAPAHIMAMHAAAPCPPSLKQAMIDWWGPILSEFYGGTESVGFCTLDSHEWLAHRGSVGRAHLGVIHVLDENNRESPPRITGRIVFSGSSAFEYFGDPAKTAGRLSPQGYQTFGDIGYVDEEGYLHLTDRLDDMIISGGVNIYPQEVEAALLEAPGITDCAVIGMPDVEYGERVVAFIVLRDDVNGALAEKSEFFANFCQQRLGSIKRPKEFRVLDKLPRSNIGKLLRRELRLMAANGL